MRLLIMLAAFLGASTALYGCGSSPTDPYSNMQMLTPQEAGAPEVQEDPVLESERNFNAKFTPKTKKKR